MQVMVSTLKALKGAFGGKIESIHREIAKHTYSFSYGHSSHYLDLQGENSTPLEQIKLVTRSKME